jgi:sulfide:quinone oxidoreductase
VSRDRDFSVCAQLQPQHLMQAAAQGFACIVNNRPDAELHMSMQQQQQQQQPTSDIMQRAAHSLGLSYIHLPITPGAAAAAAPHLKRLLSGKQQKVGVQCHALNCKPQPPQQVLAYCKSGTRSAQAYSIATEGRIV